jgi:hypothetical protein
MCTTNRSPPAQIFVIRLWQEALGDEASEWRGEIKNVITGEVRYFRTWQSLSTLLPHMLASNPPHPEDSDGV